MQEARSVVLLVFVGVFDHRWIIHFFPLGLDQTKEREIEDSPVRKVESQIQP